MHVVDSLKKISVRALVATLVFLCIKLSKNIGQHHETQSVLTLFYYLSALFFFLFTWELNDRIIKKQLNRQNFPLFDLPFALKVLGNTLLFTLPVYALTYYVAIFHFTKELQFSLEKPWDQFRADFLRASFLSVIMIALNLYYLEMKVKKELEHRMTRLEKEVVASKYKGLKSQISPHFLFNSLNTLTSLMYQDRDLASDFVSRLASCYRYILDNREKDLVKLDKELAFLDSFTFMMDVRHQMSLKITVDINLDASQFLVPTLSLQMLLENALKHNYFSKEHPLSIHIFNIDNQHICVKNTLRRRKEVEESTRLGLENIKNRYSFYTMEEVIIEQTTDIFSVSLPLLNKNVEQQMPLYIVS